MKTTVCSVLISFPTGKVDFVDIFVLKNDIFHILAVFGYIDFQFHNASEVGLF